jgi:N utilization substance protein A
MSYAVGNTEILQIADAVGREKNIPKDVILEAMEGSMAIAARKKYGHDRNVKAKINRDNGEISIFREIEVVEDGYVPEEEGEAYKIPLSEAKERQEDIEVGGYVYEALPPIDLGRVAAQTAKQVIIQKVREAERERQYNDYQPRVGEIINGVVKRVEFGHVIVDLGNAEAVIERNEQIRGEVFKFNDRVRSY